MIIQKEFELSHLKANVSILFTAKILPIQAFVLANFILFLPGIGALAQLARAFDWQSRGHRFDSDMLHDQAENRHPPWGCLIFEPAL